MLYRLLLCSLFLKFATGRNDHSIRKDFDWSSNKWEIAIREKSRAYVHRRKSMEGNGTLADSQDLAPQWLRHEKNGFYFPVVHSNVLQLGDSDWRSGHQQHHSFEHGRKLLQDSRIAAFEFGGNWPSLGGYFITLPIGSNRQPFNLHVDTGSSLLWVGCDCQENGCPTESTNGIPFEIFDSGASSTSTILGCNTTICERFSTPPFGSASRTAADVGCGILGTNGSRILLNDSSAEAILPSSNTSPACEFLVQYYDQSTTAGPLIYDDVWMQYTNESSPSKILFGCGRVQTQNEYNSTYNFDGLLGLGLSPFSLKSQLVTQGKISNSFSFCLEGSLLGGHLVLGRGDIPPGAYSAPLLNSYFYAVAVTSVSFQNLTVGTDDIFPLPAIIDTGSTLTLLTASFYDALVERILAYMGNPTVFSPFSSLTCFNLDDIPLGPLPDIILDTRNGDPWRIPYQNFLLLTFYNSEYILCFSFFRRDVTILGDSWLQNFDVVYDNENKRIHWLPVNCTTGESLDSNETLVTFPSPAVAAGYRNASSPRSPPYPSLEPLSSTSSPPSPSIPSPSTTFTSPPPTLPTSFSPSPTSPPPPPTQPLSQSPIPPLLPPSFLTPPQNFPTQSQASRPPPLNMTPTPSRIPPPLSTIGNGSLSTSTSPSFPPPNSSTVALPPVSASSSMYLQHHNFVVIVCAILLSLVTQIVQA